MPRFRLSSANSIKILRRRPQPPWNDYRVLNQLYLRLNNFASSHTKIKKCNYLFWREVMVSNFLISKHSMLKEASFATIQVTLSLEVAPLPSVTPLLMASFIIVAMMLKSLSKKALLQKFASSYSMARSHRKKNSSNSKTESRMRCTSIKKSSTFTRDSKSMLTPWVLWSVWLLVSQVLSIILWILRIPFKESSRQLNLLRRCQCWQQLPLEKVLVYQLCSHKRTWATLRISSTWCFKIQWILTLSYHRCLSK